MKYRVHRPNGYSARGTIKPVAFTCLAPEARAVFIMGDFNEWNPSSRPLARMADGGWRVELPLSHGHHRYLFVIDGEPALDPRAQGVTRNERGERVSLAAVS